MDPEKNQAHLVPRGLGAVRTTYRRLHPPKGPGLAMRSTLAGKAAGMLYERRRLPRTVLRDRLRRPRLPRYAEGSGPRDVTAVYVIPAGPGSFGDLAETIESIAAWETEPYGVVVVDDLTEDCCAPAVHARFPDADVLRPTIPTAGATRLSRRLALGFREAVARYRTQAIIKIDTDALVVGPGLGRAVADEIARNPRAGLLGTVGTAPMGFVYPVWWMRWLLAHERRWSPKVRRLVDTIEASGREAFHHVQGGVYGVNPAMVRDLDEAGVLRLRMPWWSMLGEDQTFALAAMSRGWDLHPMGGPNQAFASMMFQMGVELADEHLEGVLAVHTVRRGRSGETEAQVRDFFRARRPSAA